MKKLLICLFLGLTCSTSNGQIDTTNFIYQLDFLEYSDTLIDNQKSSLLIKFVSEKEFDELGIAQIFDRLIEEGKMTIYKDEDCTEILDEDGFMNIIFSLDRIFDIDTIITFDSETLQSDTTYRFKRLCAQALFPNERTLFQFIQHWKFDTTAQKLSNTIQIINIGYDKENRFKRLFSIKNKSSIVQNPQSELAKSSVIWAKQIEYEMAFDTINFEGVLQRKIRSEEHFNAHKIVDIHGKIIPNEIAIEQYLVSFDTLPCANLETFEPEKWIVRHCYNPENNYYYRIVQDFYFDTETNSMNTKILAIAPLRDYYDCFGNFRFRKLMFWIVYDDDFLKTFQSN